MTNKGTRFEHTAATVFRNNGYRKVQVTKATGDGGIDLAMYHKKKRIAVECKCYSREHHVSREIVQKLNTAMQYPTEYSKPFPYGYIVTTSSFTKQAIDYAYQINAVEGYDRIRLINGKEFAAMKNRATWWRRAGSAVRHKFGLKTWLFIIFLLSCALIGACYMGSEVLRQAIDCMLSLV